MIGGQKPKTVDEVIESMPPQQLIAKWQAIEKAEAAKQQAIRIPLFLQLHEAYVKLKDYPNPILHSEQQCADYDLHKVNLIIAHLNFASQYSSQSERDIYIRKRIYNQVGDIVHNLSRTLRGKILANGLLANKPFSWEFFEKLAKLIEVSAPNYTVSFNLTGVPLEVTDNPDLALPDNVKKLIQQTQFLNLLENINWPQVDSDYAQLNRLMKYVASRLNSNLPIGNNVDIPQPWQNLKQAQYKNIMRFTLQKTSQLALLDVYFCSKDFKLPEGLTEQQKWAQLRSLFRKIGELATGKQNYYIKNYHKALFNQMVELRNTFSHPDEDQYLPIFTWLENNVSADSVVVNIIPKINIEIGKVIDVVANQNMPEDITQVDFDFAGVYKQKVNQTIAEFLQIDSVADVLRETSGSSLALLPRIREILESKNPSLVPKLQQDLGQFKRNSPTPNIYKNVNKWIAQLKQKPFDIEAATKNQQNQQQIDIKNLLETQQAGVAIPELNEQLLHNPLMNQQFAITPPTNLSVARLEFVKQQINAIDSLWQQVRQQAAQNGVATVELQDKLPSVHHQLVFHAQAGQPEWQYFLQFYSTNAAFKHQFDDAVVNLLIIMIGCEQGKAGLIESANLVLTPKLKELRANKDPLRRLRAIVSHQDAMTDDENFLAGFYHNKTQMLQFMNERNQLFSSRSVLMMRFMKFQYPLLSDTVKQLHDLQYGVNTANNFAPLFQNMSRSMLPNGLTEEVVNGIAKVRINKT